MTPVPVTIRSSTQLHPIVRYLEDLQNILYLSVVEYYYNAARSHSEAVQSCTVFVNSFFNSDRYASFGSVDIVKLYQGLF